MLSPPPEDVFQLQERKTRAVGVASVSTRALCPPSPALGSQTSGHHQAWAAAVQEGIRFNSWTSSFFFFFQIPRILSRKGGRARGQGTLSHSGGFTKESFVGFVVGLRRAENKLYQRPWLPRRLLTAVYRFHMMSVKASHIQRGRTLTSPIPPRLFSRLYIIEDFHG